MTPDEMAATQPPVNPEPHPATPDTGRHVRVRHKLVEYGRTRWITSEGLVHDAAVQDDGVTVITLRAPGDDGGARVVCRLSPTSTLDGWTYTGPVETGGGEPEPPIPAPGGDSIAARHRRLQWLRARLDTLEADSAALKKEYSALERETVMAMAEEGQSSATVDGLNGHFYPKRHMERRPGVDVQDAHAALEAAGLGHMLTPAYSGAALKAYFVELGEQGIEPHPALVAAFELREDTVLRFTRAGGRTRKAKTPTVTLDTA